MNGVYRQTGNRRGLLAGLATRLRDRSGGVLILTAFAMPLLVLVVGFAADFGYASYINQRLARAADTAALSAVSQSAATAVGGYSNTAWLQIYGNSIFSENIKQLPMTNVTTNLTVVSDGAGGVVATASYSYSVKSLFGGVIGRSSIPVSGSIQSTAKPPTYVNYYILVDTSQSMGIATNQSEMKSLYNRVAQYNNGTPCVFGCHVKTGSQPYTNEDLAHNTTFGPRITLRIDSAIQAIQSIISTASATVGTTKNIKIGLYAIQLNPKTKSLITTISAPSNDYAALSTLAATYELGDNNAGGAGDSDFVNELAAFNNILVAANVTANGSGASAASPQNFVFLITDGVTDTPGGGCISGHCTGPLDSSKCTPLKNKATVGVIYTTYVPITINPNYASAYEGNYAALVAPFYNQIDPALQACASSSDYYFAASDGTDIINAMQSLFNKTLPTTARLVQ